MKKCLFCETEFVPKTVKSRFCSSKCTDKYRYYNDPKRQESIQKRLEREDVREKKRESDRRYYEQNKERVQAIHKRWREEHSTPEFYKQKRERFKETNPVRFAVGRRALYSNRKAKVLNIRGKLGTQELMDLFETHEWKCFYCKVQLNHENITVDHKIALSKGGENHISNIVPSCQTCNKRKATKTPEEFLGTLD